MLAGLAAYRSDQLRAALGYWRQSLALAPNDALNAIYQDAQREAAADRSNDKLYSRHIALRYENGALPADAARSILATLEQDYSRISAQLGMHRQRAYYCHRPKPRAIHARYRRRGMERWTL